MISLEIYMTSILLLVVIRWYYFIVKLPLMKYFTRTIDL